MLQCSEFRFKANLAEICEQSRPSIRDRPGEGERLLKAVTAESSVWSFGY